MSVTADPRSLVDHHESTMDSTRRLALGAHYTPPELATRIVALGIEALGHVPTRLLDPSCGAGSILLAAADELLAAGVAARDVPGRLVGFDVDPEALSAARRALQLWSSEHDSVDSAELGQPTLLLRDALTCEPVPPGVELVVGNPPFSSPLAAGVGPASDAELGAYTDTSARHLLAAVEGSPAGAVVCMLQPQSLLGARDATRVRTRIEDHAELLGMWFTDEQPFEAAVQVCAPVLRRPRKPRGTRARRRVAVRWRDQSPISALLESPGSWSCLLAQAMGVPTLDTDAFGESGVIGDIANCTAGFRDEFYALAAVAVDQGVDCSEAEGEGVARLVTSGMIDPATLAWGAEPRRLAGRTMLEPVVDLEALARESPKVGRWASKRLVPKVLLASQTRIIEAAIDHRGNHLPVTPVVSVEPHGGGNTPTLEALAGLLSAPSSSARIAAASAGTGRSTGSLRISASTVAGLPAPEDQRSLDRLETGWAKLGSAVCSGGDPRAAGQELDAALGVRDEALLAWWAERIESRARRT